MSDFEINPFTGKMDMVTGGATIVSGRSHQVEATAGQTLFTLPFTPDSNLSVGVNGGGQDKAIIDSISGSDATLKVAMNAGDVLIFIN